MGSRRTDAEAVYGAAETWIVQALAAGGSLFVPGARIWTSRWLGELRQRFLDRPDESKDSFLQKLQRQLADSPPEVYQLMGEALFVHFLIDDSISSESKTRTISKVLEWSPQPVEVPPKLVDALTGVGGTGPGFKTYRPYQVGLVIEFAERWKEQGVPERKRLVENPWAFKEFVMKLRLHSLMFRDAQTIPMAQRHALLHLIHPDAFEGIVSQGHKNRIAKAFSHLVTDPTGDVDRKLAQIRASLEPHYGSGNHLFYDPRISEKWNPQREVGPWEEFIRHARAYRDSGRLYIEEVDYKLNIGSKLAEAREAVVSGHEQWRNLMKRNLIGNLIHPIGHSRFRHWIDRSPEDALQALQAFWMRDDAPVSQRIRNFSKLLPLSVSSGSGTRTTLMSVLLMGLDAERYPPFRSRLFYKAYSRIGYPMPEQGSDEAGLYEHALNFLDLLIEEASERDLEVRNRLEAQSLVWAVMEDRLPPPPPPPEAPWASQKVAELEADLLWEPGDLQRIIYGLQDKQQAIFQGPPGTGKTYVAKRIGEWCKQHGGDFEIVQFHPSYSYEDFVEGFRPTLTDEGRAGFKLTKGPLRRIAEKARDNPNATYILVIDEINRGNVSKVLGELYFLLEYRNEKVTLQYRNDETFILPKNLWLIGTMNTTDRSIALVDAALRRRFYFFGFFPDEAPIAGLLERWLGRNGSDAKWVSDLVSVANKKLKDRHLGIGPSHFMKLGLTEGKVRFIWEQAVLPYLAEQFFGDEERLKEFGFDRLMTEVVLALEEQEALTDQESDTDDGEPADASG